MAKKVTEGKTEKILLRQLSVEKNKTYLLKGAAQKVCTFNEIDFPTKEDDPECDKGYDVIEKATGRVIMTCSHGSKIKWSPSGEVEVEIKKHEDPKIKEE